LSVRKTLQFKVTLCIGICVTNFTDNLLIHNVTHYQRPAPCFKIEPDLKFCFFCNAIVFIFYVRIAIPGNRTLVASTAVATPSSSTLNRRAVAIVDVKRTSSQRLPNTTKPPLWFEKILSFVSFRFENARFFCTPFSFVSCFVFKALFLLFLCFTLL
jgi:hypothetical protein